MEDWSPLDFLVGRALRCGVCECSVAINSSCRLPMARQRQHPTPSRTAGRASRLPEEDSSGEISFDSEILRNQLVLLGLLVFFVGTVSTEAYYTRFGIRYQLLGFPASHILYRGLATLIEAWYLLVLYIIAVAWILVLDLLIRRKGRASALISAYIVLFLLLCCAYPLSRIAGFQQARLDMTEGKSRLATVECLSLSESHVCDSNFRRFRHLISSSGEVVVFRPVNQNAFSSVPIVIHLPQGDVHELRTSTPD